MVDGVDVNCYGDAEYSDDRRDFNNPSFRVLVIIAVILWDVFSFSGVALAHQAGEQAQVEGLFSWQYSVPLLVTISVILAIALGVMRFRVNALEISARRQDQEMADKIAEAARRLKTEQEKQLYKEKMTLLGRVSGGISHDLRNPLGAIKNAVFFLNMALEEPDPDIAETIEIIEREIANSERIITSLTEFSMGKSPARRKVALHDVVEATLSITPSSDRVKVENLLSPMPEILGDPDQLGKIFYNIFVNAIKSMPEGGELVVRPVEWGENRVAVAAQDTGCGIPEENFERVYEPFFTTRAKGIGLGLTLTRDMVEENGGTIDVESRLGEGSTFTVSFPIP